MNICEFTIAKRYLFSRKGEGFISVIALFSLAGMMLGVATLITVMSVMNGFRAELLGRILGINGHIEISAYNKSGMPNYDDLIQNLQKNPEVTTIIPLIERQVLASADGKSQGAFVRSVRPSDIKNLPMFAGNLEVGDWRDFKGESVVLGFRLARRLGIDVGDSVSLLSPEGRVTVFGSVPKMKTYRVVGLFDVNMYEYDSNYALMPLSEAQNFFGLKNQVTGVDIWTKDVETSVKVAGKMRDIVPSKFQILDWQQANAPFFNALEVERTVMFMILALMILVAAFNMVSSLVMLVREKQRDIAILRTMGATKGQILRIFMLTGLMIGVSGTLMGLALGLGFSLHIEEIRQVLQHVAGRDLFAAEIYFLSHLPAKVEWDEVTIICGLSLLLSFLSTLYPAFKAARLDPIKGLHHD